VNLFRGHSLYTLSLLVLSTISAFCGEGLERNWPKVKDGSVLEIESVKDVPESLVSELKLLFGSDENSADHQDGNRFSFFKLGQNQNYVLIKNQGSYPFEVSTLIKRENGRLTKVALPVGNPNEGFTITSDLGSSEIDLKNGNFTTLFFFDVCGDEVWYSEYKYHFARGQFKLLHERQVNCGTGQWRTIWSSELPPEWPLGHEGGPIVFDRPTSIPPFLKFFAKGETGTNAHEITSARFYRLKTGLPLVSWTCRDSGLAMHFGIWQDGTLQTANFIVANSKESFQSRKFITNSIVDSSNGDITTSNRSDSCNTAKTFNEHHYSLRYGGYQLRKVVEINCVNGTSTVTWKSRD
jgi:hypothetical protein